MATCTVIPVIRRHSVELALRGEWLWIVFMFVVQRTTARVPRGALHAAAYYNLTI